LISLVNVFDIKIGAFNNDNLFLLV